MSSRDTILKSVRRNRPPAVELPPQFEKGITFADPRGQFLSVLEQVGGRGLVASDMSNVSGMVQSLPVVQEAKTIVSLVNVIVGNLDLSECREPHELAGVDVAILRGQFGVAENAAVWITDEGVTERAIYFICQHLVLLVPAREIVHNMHEAYERLGRVFDQPKFGCFLSGPSKTADIEQSLVIGAQGPRSLTVVLVEG